MENLHERTGWVGGGGDGEVHRSGAYSSFFRSAGLPRGRSLLAAGWRRNTSSLTGACSLARAFCLFSIRAPSGNAACCSQIKGPELRAPSAAPMQIGKRWRVMGDGEEALRSRRVYVRVERGRSEMSVEAYLKNEEKREGEEGRLI
ncbi:hypothetical protein ElyMa_004452700 [Elysia marginata]|uniref:Uncharacterized protein n=1 Tax=Elysia marginata TaxID=1093978 RepID=A0AAV4HIG6_9GAST|nr:hypothetical protein ElyMa_004452700 [Elysia marginata]